MSDKSNEKISLKRLISNLFYVIGFAWQEDKAMVFAAMGGSILLSVGNAIVDTVFLKIIIDMITGDTPFISILHFMIFQLIFFASYIIVQNLLDQFFEARIVKVSGNIQRMLLEKAAVMDLICYDKTEYFNDFVIAAQQGEQMVYSAVRNFGYTIANILAMLVAGGVIFSISPVIAAFPILGFIINIVTRFAIAKLEYQYDLEKKKINRKTDYSKRVFYQPEYAKEIKLSGIAEALKLQFNESLDEEKQMAKKYGKKIAVLSLINWIFTFTLLSFFCLPVYLGYLALVKMSIALGDVASLNNAANTIRGYLDALNYNLISFQQVGQYAEKFRKFNDYKENIETTKGKKAVPDEGELELKNVSYGYDGTDKLVLKNVNLRIAKGEKIAIVGENGAGKTTLIKLIMRLYDVSGGEITYGGINIKDFDIREYREKIGAVFQDYQIYAGTLGENIFMDKYDKNENAAAILALEKADFGDKLQKLGGGLETELTREFSDEGTMLSGGEGQKVAVSRMFAKGSCPIAILDEPSSALDPNAEYKLNKSMMENAKNSAIIFISHRLSTTREADKIYLFENGEIAEQGTHDELMKMDGSYAEMFEVQARQYKLNAS